MAANGELVVAGVRSPYPEAGDQGDREAVIFEHGNPGPATDWSGLLECVGGVARGIAMDFPEYGTAGRPSRVALLRSPELPWSRLWFTRPEIRTAMRSGTSGRRIHAM